MNKNKQKNKTKNCDSDIVGVKYMTTLFVPGLFIDNSASTHLDWLQRYQLYRKYWTDKDSMKF